MGFAESTEGRVVGLDPGARWIGVAVSDAARRLALPLLTIDRRVDADAGAARIVEALGPEGASLVVVGVPLRPDGAEDTQAREFRALGEQIAAALALPCEAISERFSNPLEEPPPPRMDARGRRPRGRTPARRQRARAEEHAVAAAAILQRWLDAQRAATGAGA